MIEFYRSLAKMPNYVKRFGIIQGLRLLHQIERKLDKRSSTVRSYRVLGFSSPIYLRDTIADHAIFWQCIVDNQYDFRRFPQAERLIQSYNRLVEQNRKPLIIDCGGNIGLAAVWLANALPQARIVTIEPEKENFNLLLKNILL